MNSHGKLLKITTFWESHGAWLGVVIDGFPANFPINEAYIASELDRRKTGKSSITSARQETEAFEILSWVFEGKTTGHPITFLIRNSNADSSKYENIKNIFRPNHADLTYTQKYGIRDYRGGGRSSGRETVSRVLAGALAKDFLSQKLGVKIYAYTKQIADIKASEKDFEFIEKNEIRTADKSVAEKMLTHIQKIASTWDSIGGIIECTICHPPKNLWEPVFDKIKSRLAGSMLSLGAIVWFEYGTWFESVYETGSSYNQGFVKNNENISSKDNRYGGILWGISTGEDIIFRVAVKPTASIYKKQTSITENGDIVDFAIEGRHDPCILPRVIPVIESMCALDILDLFLIDRARLGL